MPTKSTDKIEVAFVCSYEELCLTLRKGQGARRLISILMPYMTKNEDDNFLVFSIFLYESTILKQKTSSRQPLTTGIAIAHILQNLAI